MNSRFKVLFVINLFMVLSFNNVYSEKLYTMDRNEQHLQNIVDIGGKERIKLELPETREIIDTPENPDQE